MSFGLVPLASITQQDCFWHLMRCHRQWYISYCCCFHPCNWRLTSKPSNFDWRLSSLKRREAPITISSRDSSSISPPLLQLPSWSCHLHKSLDKIARSGPVLLACSFFCILKFGYLISREVSNDIIFSHLTFQLHLASIAQFGIISDKFHHSKRINHLFTIKYID